eukprot:1739178-Rhodomonas_salina.1
MPDTSARVAGAALAGRAPAETESRAHFPADLRPRAGRVVSAPDSASEMQRMRERAKTQRMRARE